MLNAEPTRSSLALAIATPRDRVAVALDLGTGRGYQAALLSQHCGEVIATDIDLDSLEAARAEFARLQLDNVHAILGDGLPPVVFRQFDLVVSNTPFLIAPPLSDGPLRSGHMNAWNLLVDLPACLAPAARVALTASWAVRPGSTWQDEIRRLAPAEGWLLSVRRLQSNARDIYAEIECTVGARHIDAYRTEVDRWVDYLNREYTRDTRLEWGVILGMYDPELCPRTVIAFDDQAPAMLAVSTPIATRCELCLWTTRPGSPDEGQRHVASAHSRDDIAAFLSAH